jgi:hypothetical protein
MGRPVCELQAVMPITEFMEWIAFFKIRKEQTES